VADTRHVPFEEEHERMRQWELFGITDSDPAWTPPKRQAERNEEIPEDFAQDLAVLRLAVEAQDDRVPEPAA